MSFYKAVDLTNGSLMEELSKVSTDRWHRLQVKCNIRKSDSVGINIQSIFSKIIIHKVSDFKPYASGSTESPFIAKGFFVCFVF